MKRLITTILFLFLLHSLVAQTYQPVNSYGFIWKRGIFNNAIFLPQGTGTEMPSDTVRAGGIRYNPALLQVQVWNGSSWGSLLPGTGIFLDSVYRSNDTLYFRKTNGGGIAVKIAGLPIGATLGLQDSLNKHWDSTTIKNNYYSKTQSDNRFQKVGKIDSVTQELLIRKSVIINPNMSAQAFGDSYINGAGASIVPDRTMFTILTNVLQMKTTSNWSKSGSGMLLSAARSFIRSKVVNNDTAQFLWSGYNDLRRTGASAKGIGQLTNGLRSFITNQFLTTAVAGSDGSITYGSGWTQNWVSVNYGGKATNISSGFGAQTTTASTTATWSFTGNNVVIGTFGSDGSTVLDSFYVYIDNILIGGYNFNNTYGGVADLSPAPIDNKIGPAVVVVQNLSNAAHTLKITKGMGSGKLIIDYLGTMRAPAKCYPIVVAEIPYFTQFEYAYSLSNWGVMVNDSIVNDFNTRIRNVVREFNGYPVTTSPTNNYLLRPSDFISDSTHPNDAGHLHCALSMLSIINPNTSTLQSVTREGKTTTDSIRLGSAVAPTKQLDVTGSSQISDSTFVGDITNTTAVPTLNISRNTGATAIMVTHRIATGYITQPGFSEVTYPSYNTSSGVGYAWSFNVNGSNPFLTLRNSTYQGMWLGSDLYSNSVLKITANSTGFNGPSNLFSIKDSLTANFLLNCSIKFGKFRMAVGDSIKDSTQFYVSDTALITKLIVGPKPPYTSLFPLYPFTNTGGLYMHYCDGSNNPTLQFSKFAGTYLAPTAVLKSTNLFAIAATPYNGTAFSGTMVSITAGAAEDQTTSARGGYIDFQTTPKGTTSRNTNVTITDNGNVLIGQRNGTTVWSGGTPYDSSLARLDIVNPNDTATLSPSIAVRGNMLPNRAKRTVFSVLPNGNIYVGGTFKLSNTAPGSISDNILTKSGTDSTIKAISSGSFIQNQVSSPQTAAFSITGDSRISGGLSLGKSTSPATVLDVNGDVTAVTPTAGRAYWIRTTGGLARWGLGTITTEGVLNSGSDLVLSNYDSTGTFLSNVFTCTRASGYLGFNTATPTNRMHIKGSVRIEDGAPGVGKVWEDTTGTGVGAWRTTLFVSSGTPTFSPSGSVTSILGTGYSVTITGSGNAFVVTITTGTGISTTGTIGSITLNTAFPSTPVAVYSAKDINAIGTTVGFSATNSSTITLFDKTQLTDSQTYNYSVIVQL